jgi:tetratricopeptide (TPR) repeat protein
MVESAAMSARGYSRKDLKHDEFVTTTGEIGRWLMERRHRIGWGLLAVVVMISIVAMVGVYRQRQESSAAALLAVAMEVYRAPIVEETTTAPAVDAAAAETAATEPGAGGAEEGGAEAAGETPSGAEPDSATEATDPGGEGTASTAAAEAQSPVARNRFTTEAAKFEAAREEFAPIVTRYGSTPSGRIAAFYLGLCESSLGNEEAAEEALQRAAAASQEIISTLALYRLGELQLAAGKSEEAIASFDLLLTSDSDSFPADEALMSKARAQEAAGDLRGAMLSYQRVVDEHPDSFAATDARTRAEELSAELGLDPNVERL